ncbi:MAG TPA: hypothetical protein EYQ24_16010 [Bacteroidetes bacterium]|nr:hypothetical protein [Bacteroidota bacterium]
MPLSGVAEVTVGYRHSCARTHGGAVWCWGTPLGLKTWSASAQRPASVNRNPESRLA